MPTPTIQDPEWKAIAEVVQDHVEGVTNAGHVYVRERGTKFYTDIMTHKVKAAQLNVWEIVTVGWAGFIPYEGGGAGNLPLRHRKYTFQIIGHLAYRDGTDDDNSTHQFYQMVEDIEEAILDDYFLNSTLIKPITSVNSSIDYAMYGSIYCHECEITFEAEVRLNSA